VITVVVLLLATLGLAVTLAIQLPARRRDAASLRVLGVRRSSILASVAVESVAVLITAAGAGILAGAVANDVVVRHLTLGYADSSATPRVVSSLDLAVLGGVCGATVILLLLLSVALGGITVRGARGSRLREETN
jgi:ABC-type antimicrobial peptide transport system permease subunit